MAEKKVQRCIGCRWRMPRKLGGEGIICFWKDGKCPDWAVDWALRYGENEVGLLHKSFATDEDLLEAMRI